MSTLQCVLIVVIFVCRLSLLESKATDLCDNRFCACVKDTSGLLKLNCTFDLQQVRYKCRFFFSLIFIFFIIYLGVSGPYQPHVPTPKIMVGNITEMFFRYSEYSETAVYIYYICLIMRFMSHLKHPWSLNNETVNILNRYETVYQQSKWMNYLNFFYRAWQFPSCTTRTERSVKVIFLSL